MSGQNRQLLAEMARPKTPKGSALKSALGRVFSPMNIFKTKPETQPIKKRK